MDKRIRRNEICVIGLPACDYVFSSTRSCFIGYGFDQSALETSILTKLLGERGIEAVEAGGMRAPAQNAFCAKICSKIITSQFCVILLNHESTEQGEVPNANVNMEYGLMLGFSKYVIPFQRAAQALPFNVAGLDTIKYSDRDFERLAAEEIDRAVEATTQDAPPEVAIDELLSTFLVNRQLLVASVDTVGDRDIFSLGAAVGFNLLVDFSGFQYTFLGNFTAIRPEVAVWRVRMLDKIIESRRATFDIRQKLGMGTAQQMAVAEVVFRNFRALLVVTSDVDKEAVQGALVGEPVQRDVEVVSLEDVRRELQELGGSAA